MDKISNIYFQNHKMLIRDMLPSDAQIITDGEIEQGWDQSIEKYNRRLRDAAAGKCVSLAAEFLGQVAGYVNVYPDSAWGAFGGQGLPEIIDFGVLEKYRRRGVGTKLMDVAEQIAAQYADTVYLGVGLHSGYGSAQRMYIKRGYVPDGSGVWYKNQPAEPYSLVPNGDELVLYLSKRL